MDSRRSSEDALVPATAIKGYRSGVTVDLTVVTALLAATVGSTAKPSPPAKTATVPFLAFLFAGTAS